MSWIAILAIFLILLAIIAAIAFLIYYNTGVPSAPTNLVAKMDGPNVILTWNPSRNADRYIVCLGNQIGKCETTYPTPVPRLNLGNIASCTHLFISVKAQNLQGESPATEISFNTELGTPVISDMVRRGNILSVEWLLVSGATSYVLKAGKDMENLTKESISSTSTAVVDVSAFGQCVPLYAVVVARKGDCESEDSDFGKLEPIALPKTTIERIEQLEPGVVIQWSRINENNVLYQVELNVDGRGWERYGQLTSQTRSERIGLGRVVTTMIRIRAERMDGCFSYSDEKKYP